MKKKINTLVVTSFFYKNKNFLDSFVNSLNAQSDKNFDIIISHDKKNYTKFINKLNCKKIYFIPEKKKIFLNKINLLSICQKLKYDIFVFADSDDAFSKNRVKETKKLLKNNNFIVNDVSTISPFIKKNVFSKYFYNLQKIKKEDLICGNFLGLSNIAFKKKTLLLFNLKNIKKIYKHNKSLFPVDWLLWLILLCKENKVIFTNKIITKYRINPKSITNFYSKSNKIILQYLKFQLKIFGILRSLDKIYLKRFNELNKLRIKLKNIFFYHKYYKKFAMSKKYLWFYLPKDNEKL
jgi:hypothetical protein